MRKAQQILEIKKRKQNVTKLKEENQQPKEQEQEDEPVKPSKRNMFAAFSSESEQQTKPKQQLEQNKVNEQIKPVPKKKKNKKKKVQQKNQEEYLDELIKQSSTNNPLIHAQEQQDESLKIFRIYENRFNYENELKKYFKNTEQQQVAQNYEGMNKRQKKFHKAMQHIKMKKSVLIPTMLNYFPIAEKFEFVQKQNVLWIQASKKYEVLQEEYQSIKNSNDIQQMFDFMQRNPYHTDALYNIGEFFRLKGNYKEADALIQRIIYIYEYSSQYNIGLFLKEDKPTRQIAYGRYSSSFFMSLFKFVDILGKKGCYRSALEYSKFLLKLNFTDPSACLLSFDFNALSAKQYKFLIDFTSGFSSYFNEKKSTTLYWLPNFTYSVAFAKFMAQTDIQSKTIIEESNVDFLLNFTDKDLEVAMDTTKLSDFEKQSVQVLILRAILLYPRVMLQISEKNDYAKQNLYHPSFSGYQKGNFKSITGHKFFQLCPQNYFYTFLELQNDSDSKGLVKVIQCYITRSKILWKNNKIMLWVKAATGFLLNYIDSHQDFNYQSFQQSLSIKSKITESIPDLCLQLRQYQNVSKANFTDQVQRIDLNNIQDNQGFQAHQQPQNYNPVNLQENPIRLFLNTLLPWVHLPNQGQQQHDPDMPIIEQDHP